MNFIKKNRKFILIGIILLLIISLGVSYLLKDEEIAYNEFISHLENNNVESIIIKDDNKAKIVLKDNKKVFAMIPDIEHLMKYLDDKIKNEEITFSIDVSDNTSTLISIMELMFSGAVLFIFYKMMSKGNMSNSIINNTDVNVNFGNVAGLKEEKEEIQEVVGFITNKQKYTKAGAKMPKGIMFVGKPGTGKTLLAKAMAGELDIPFFYTSGSDFVELYAGMGAKKVRDLFKQARKQQPCIIFIDEIDAVGKKRSNNSNSDEREQTLNQLLVEMDGFKENESIIVIAATNRIDVLDEALLRAGRFDKRIFIGLPDIKAREQILRLYSKNKNIDKNIDYLKLAKNTSGLSGADLENIMNESAIIAVRNKRNVIITEDVEEAIVKVIMGPEKKSKVISEKDKKRTAYHEAGHALVAHYNYEGNPVQEISIIPRGTAGGYTRYNFPEEIVLYSKKELSSKILVLLAGYVSEEIVLGSPSTGSVDDIKKSTELAESSIKEYGMSEKIGPICYNDLKDSSEKTKQLLEKSIRTVINNSYDYLKDYLNKNIDKLHEVSAVLIEKEKISGEEFLEILNK